MQDEAVFVGVDASKAELVNGVHGQPGCAALPNQDAPVAAWLQTLPPGAKVAVESTGECHLTLVRQAVRLGVTVYVLNARDVYFYAKALGMRAKTDRVDARVIARYLAEHHAQLRPYRLPSPTQAEIEQLLGQRWVAVTKRTALRQALRGSPAIDQQVQHLDASFDSLLETIDQRIEQLIDADPTLKASQRQLLTIVGVGSQASALLSSLLARLQFVSADALVAFSGLDPRAQDSGRSHGKRRLSKRGSPDLRRQMYMVAMSACHSKVFGPLYQQLRSRGFKTTEALVILARKLLRVAYAVWRSGKPFEPDRFAIPG
jgi:transposase